MVLETFFDQIGWQLLGIEIGNWLLINGGRVTSMWVTKVWCTDAKGVLNSTLESLKMDNVRNSKFDAIVLIHKMNL